MLARGVNSGLVIQPEKKLLADATSLTGAKFCCPNALEQVANSPSDITHLTDFLNINLELWIIYIYSGSSVIGYTWEPRA